MEPNQNSLQTLVVSRSLRLNALIYGVTLGLFAGLAIFIATNWLVLKGGGVVGPHLSLLGQYFVGYRVTFVGSLIGLAYGFVCGLTVGYFGAVIYNWIADLREKRGVGAPLHPSPHPGRQADRNPSQSG